MHKYPHTYAYIYYVSHCLLTPTHAHTCTHILRTHTHARTRTHTIHYFLPTDQQWFCDPSSIQFGESIGEGQFGDVFRGVLSQVC